MVKVNGPAMSLEASGSLGGALVFSKWKGRPYVRELVRPANPRSGLQVGMRSMFAFLAQQWQNLTSVEQATWQAQADAIVASPFNGYMQINQKRWRDFRAPSQDTPITAAGTVGATATTSATAGVRSVTVSAEFATINQNWGVIVHRSTTTSFTPSLSDAIKVLLVDTAATPATFIDSPLVADTYYYNYTPFTDDGVLGAALGEDSAVVA